VRLHARGAHILICVQQRVMPLHTPLLCHVQQYDRAFTRLLPHPLCAAAGHYALAHTHAVCMNSCVHLHDRSHTHVYVQQGTMPLHTPLLCVATGSCVCTPAHTIFVSAAGHYARAHTYDVCRSGCVRLHARSYTHVCAAAGHALAPTPAVSCAAIQPCVARLLPHPLCAAAGHHALAHTHAVCMNSCVHLHDRSHTHMCAAAGHQHTRAVCSSEPCVCMCVQQEGTVPLDTLLLCT
jgi:hypothetical protein